MKPALRRTHRRLVIALLALPLLVSGCQRARGAADPTPASNLRPAGSTPDLPLAGTDIPLFAPGKSRALAQNISAGLEGAKTVSALGAATERSSRIVGDAGGRFRKDSDGDHSSTILSPQSARASGHIVGLGREEE